MTRCAAPSCHEVTPNPGLYGWKNDETGRYFCRLHSPYMPAPSPDRMRKGGKVGNMWRRRKSANN